MSRIESPCQTANPRSKLGPVMIPPAPRLFLGLGAFCFLTSCGYRVAAPAREKVCVPFVQNETPHVGLAAALTKELRRLLAMGGSRVEGAASACPASGTLIAVRLRRAVRGPGRLATRGGHLVEVDGFIELEALVAVSEPGRKKSFDVSVSGAVPRAAGAPGDDLITSARSGALTEDLAREIVRSLEVW